MTVGAKTEEDQKRKAIFKKEEATKEDAKTENAEVQVDDEPIHEGFSCNNCEMQPIVGARYKCLECDFRVSSVYSFTDDIMSSAALRALITTCVRPV